MNRFSDSSHGFAIYPSPNREFWARRMARMRFGRAATVSPRASRYGRRMSPPPEQEQPNSDRAQLAIVHTSSMEWTASPSPTVWRKRLEHSGDIEKGRVTSLVRYDPGARFPAHGHPLGEEILVLDGVFSDEHGHFPKGSFLLNPAGFTHAPFSEEGCLIFVKLRQYPGSGRPQVRVDTTRAAWQPHPIAGVSLMPLYGEPEHPETIRLVRMDTGARVPHVAFPGGEEIFVISGAFRDEHGQYQTGSWVRYPPGSGHTPATDTGCVLYVKKGHLSA
jgi:anti-sigma factor ChrR (cupin superfamily)